VVVQFSFRGWTRSASRSTRSIETLRDNGKAMLTLNKDFGLGNVHVLPQKTTLPLQWIDVLPERIPQYELLEPVVPVPSSAWTACVVGRAARVPAVVTCAEHPDLYRQSAAGNERAIGCQDALRLGESPPPAYADVPAAAGASHRVLRSLQQPGRFIVLPALFKITRSGPEAGERAFRPNILVHAALGGSGGDRYVFTAGLAPAIRMHEWAALVRQLRGMCPPGVEPQVQLPLEPTVQAQLAYSWTLPPDIAEPVVTRTWEGFQVAVSAQLAAGLLLNSLIETSGLHGEVEFTLPGGLAVSSMLVLDTDVVGPWQSSPVTVAVRRDEATLVNRAERPADVFSLLTHGGELAATVDQTLAPGQQLKVPLDTAPGELIAVHSLHNSSLRIEQLSAYVSDVTTTLHIVNLVNYANSGLTRLDLEVKHAGAVHECPIDERGEAEVALTFPLTSYLAARTVDVRVLQTFAEGRTTVTAWFPWDLASAGGVLSLTSQLIGLPPPS
jgi:hypothetical protein